MNFFINSFARLSITTTLTDSFRSEIIPVLLTIFSTGLGLYHFIAGPAGNILVCPGSMSDRDRFVFPFKSKLSSS